MSVSKARCRSKCRPWERAVRKGLRVMTDSAAKATVVDVAREAAGAKVDGAVVVARVPVAADAGVVAEAVAEAWVAA